MKLENNKIFEPLKLSNILFEVFGTFGTDFILRNNITGFDIMEMGRGCLGKFIGLEGGSTANVSDDCKIIQAREVSQKKQSIWKWN